MRTTATCVVNDSGVPHIDGMSFDDRVALASSVTDPAVAWRLFKDGDRHVRTALAANRSPSLTEVVTKIAAGIDRSSEIALENPILPMPVKLKRTKKVCSQSDSSALDRRCVAALLRGECSEAVLLAVAEGTHSTTGLLQKAVEHRAVTEPVRVAVLRNPKASLRAISSAICCAESPHTVDLVFTEATARRWRDTLNPPASTGKGNSFFRDYSSFYARQLLNSVVHAPGATIYHLHAVAVESIATHDAILARSEAKMEPLLPTTLAHIGLARRCTKERAMQVAEHPRTDLATLTLLGFNRLQDVAQTAAQQLGLRLRAQRASEIP